MFCPQCGSTQPDDLKFCKTCGANLSALRQVMATGETDEKFNWGKTWVAEMFMSSEEQVKRAAEIDRLRGVTPETKRRNEIKAGVILAGTGIALAIFLFIFMQGVILGGVSETAAAILARIWIVGIIPLFVGSALIVNGTIVSKLFADRGRAAENTQTPSLKGVDPAGYIPAARSTNELTSGVPFSVTDETTRNLVPEHRGKKMEP